MPLFSEHISNMYYGGSPSYSSPYSSYSSSLYPLGTSYSASYLNPGGNYSTHSSLSSYSRAPLTSRWMPGMSRNYSPMLTPISERGTSSPVRINSPRRIPISKRSYGTSAYTQRPININTADIDVSRDKYRRKSIETPCSVAKLSPQKEPSSDEKEKSPFMPRVDGKPETGIDSSPGLQRSTIKRGRTVVRLHTMKRKERDSPRKPIEIVEAPVVQNASMISADENSENNSEIDSNERKGWREKLSEDLNYTEKREKKSLGTKFVEAHLVKHSGEHDDKILKSNSSTEIIAQNLPVSPVILHSNSDLPPTGKSERRCSMELLAEQASVLDALIKGENLSTATLDLSKVGVAEEPKPSLELNQKKKSGNRQNPLKTTKSDQSLHENLKSLRNNKDSKTFSKGRSLKKSSSGGTICRLDSITEFPKEPIQIDLPAIEEIRTSIKIDKAEEKRKPKLKTKITGSVEISSPSSPLKFRIENVTVEEKVHLPKKEISFSSTVEDSVTQDVTLQSPLKRTKERRSTKKKISDPASPEPEDGDFWDKIGKRETVYLMKRKQNLTEEKEKHKRALFLFPEDGNSEFPEATDQISSSILPVTEPNITHQEDKICPDKEVDTQFDEYPKSDTSSTANVINSGELLSISEDTQIKPFAVESQNDLENSNLIKISSNDDIPIYKNDEKQLIVSETYNESREKLSSLKLITELIPETKKSDCDEPTSGAEEKSSQLDENLKETVCTGLTEEPKESRTLDSTYSKDTSETDSTKIEEKSDDLEELHSKNRKENLEANVDLHISNNQEKQNSIKNNEDVTVVTSSTELHESPQQPEKTINIDEGDSQKASSNSQNKDKEITLLETKSNIIKEKNAASALKKQKSANKADPKNSSKKANLKKSKTADSVSQLKNSKVIQKCPIHNTANKTENSSSNSAEKIHDQPVIATSQNDVPAVISSNTSEKMDIIVKTELQPPPLAATSNDIILPSDASCTNVLQIPIVTESVNIPKIALQIDLSKGDIEKESVKQNDESASPDKQTDINIEEQRNETKKLSVKTEAPRLLPNLRKPVKEEKALRPLIATPRPLQKRVPQVIHSSESSDSSSDDESSDDEEESDASEDSTEFFECENNTDGRTSTGSNDSGFDSSAPTSPSSFVHIKKDCDVNCHRKCEKLTANLCGVNQRLLVEALATRTASKKGADGPGPSSSNAASQLPATDILEQELEQSTAYGIFRKTGRFTPPARSIPRFRKYVVEDFQFIKVLGKGSFGKVLLAELRDTEYYYAVKCLKKDVVLEDDDVECTLIERKVLALGTNHPYLCHLFATFQTDSHLFFVMEYLNGGDLMFHIQQSGRFPETRARFYGAEIVSGLKFLHKRGIVYRDLKLDNILLDFDGHVRIADFGMCKLQIYLDKTADTFCGTPDYMAPEIIKGLKYNQAVDWWSFGVLLYEMLIGQSPFSGCDEDELFWSICNEMPSYPRFLSQEALTILTRFLDKDARTRLGGGECMHGDIRDQDFFRQIQWERLERRDLEAPFRPRVRHPLDTQYFDRAFTGERPRLTAIEPHVLRSMDQEPFRGFSYTNPNATDR